MYLTKKTEKYNIFASVFSLWNKILFPARIKLIELFLCFDFKLKLCIFKEHIGH